MRATLTTRARMLRARFRRWSVQRRRIVPRPVLIRLRAIGIVLMVIGIVIHSLAGWEERAQAAPASFSDGFSSGTFDGSEGSAAWVADDEASLRG